MILEDPPWFSLGSAIFPAQSISHWWSGFPLAREWR